uniref:Cystine knot toxin n=1 Tax=Dolomedes mizhoanus TaxID=1366394 RepID=S5MYD7_9ARAC|nr:cystine knot toxin [Dolomedes mizhoanus]
MMKSILVFAFLIAAVYAFAVEENTDLLSVVAEDEIIPEEARKSLPEGAECDGDGSDCQCYGKWHKCGCPFFWKMRGLKCHCTWGMKHTCITKLSCPNRGEWGLDWRSEESGRSPC